MSTRDTAARVRGVPRCVKIHYRTHTRQTCDLKPVGFPIPVTIPNSYAKLLGELQYVTNTTRLDISYAINKLASYTANPSLEHYGSLKHILRYLAGTRDY